MKHGGGNLPDFIGSEEICTSHIRIHFTTITSYLVPHANCLVDGECRGLMIVKIREPTSRLSSTALGVRCWCNECVTCWFRAL